MEAAAALREDGKTTEEAAGEGMEGLSLGFGCASPHLHRQPHHKLLRSDAFPFRVASSSSHAAAGVSTASDGRVSGPPPSPARTLASPPNSGVNVGGGGGGTAALGHGGISDSYGTPRALRPVNSPVTGLAGDATLQLCSSFTAAQWQELHRQALIFKCFVTATPVPPDLLPARSPFSGGHPFFSNLNRGGDYLNLRFTGANADLEPGRCRRTDGKKWRCSREVAPGQKYCERHVHRARPRSRKPVELAGRADPAAAASAAETVSTAAKPAAARPSAQSSAAGLPTSGADDPKLPFQFLVPEDHKKLRYLGSSGGVRAEVLPATKHWQLPHPKMGLQQQHDWDNRVNLRCSSLNYDHHGCPFPGTDISASDADPHDPRDAPRCFIDAWSRSESNPFDGVTIGDDHKTDSGGGGGGCVRSLEYLSPSSSLTLSMSGTGVGGGEHHDHFQMGIHAADSPAGKMLAPSWMMRRPASPIGGPLAEVLQTTSSSTVSFRDVERAGRHENDAAARGGGGLIDLMCRTSCDSEGASPPRGFSSPTRVLQKALVSPSDSSSNSNSNSSPTFGLGRRPELGLQWASPYN